MRFVVKRISIFAFLILLLPFLANAQTSTGTIVGTVTDKSGAPVPKASVKVSSPQFGEIPRTMTTDSAGHYRVESLLPGNYTVLIEAGGFDQVKIQDIQVKGSLEVSANATLEISSLKNVVVVEASAAQALQTESGSLGAEISEAEIRNLPIFSLNPVELVLTQPGVQDNTNQMGFSNGINFSVNGTRPRANNFLIDGQDNNDNGINGQAFQTQNLQAVQEVTILTNAYAAEYGRGGGSVTNEISKTGTNAYHGEAWELNRNSAFAAVPAQNGLVGVTKNPQDNENTFGFDFGGPIKRNKLFFFGTLQDDRDYSASQGATLFIPDAAGIATLKTLLPNPNVQLLLDSLSGLVAPTAANPIAVDLGAGRGIVTENVFQRSGIPSIQLNREWRVRLDWNATPSDSVSASYRRADFGVNLDFFNFPATLPPFDTQQSGPSQAFTGNWTHTFSPSALNELRFSYSNIDFTFGPTSASASGPLANTPGISFAGESNLPTLGIPTGEPQFRGHKSYQFQDALSYTIKRHTFKFGADVDYLQINDGVPFNSRGTITFQGGGNFSDLGNFVDDFTGATGSIAINFGNPVVQPFFGIYAPYVEDTWHVKTNLTVNLGLRYEYWGTPGNILQFPSVDTAQFGFGLVNATFPGLVSAPERGDKNNFAPRVGFAYTPHVWERVFGHDKTVIRGGYGIFYDGLFSNILDNNDSTSPNATGFNITTSATSGRGVGNAFGTLAAATATPDPLATVNSIANNLRNPLTHQWNLDIQRELPGGLIFTAAYVGTRGEHLYTTTELNPGDGTGNPGPSGISRLNNNFGSVAIRDNGGDSIYHSGQFTLDRKFAHGLLLRGAYTYSKLIDDTSEVFTTTGGSSFSEDVLRQSSDRGLSAYDRRHRFVGAYVWDVPGVHSSSNMAMNALSYVTRGWSWSGTFTGQSGNPETIFDGVDVNGDGHSGNDRPSLGNPAAPFSSVGIDGSQLGKTPGTIFGPYLGCLTGGACTAQSASNFHFIVPAVGVQGNLGRNSYIGPGQWFYDTAVSRTFKIHERHQITFRTEFFNAFNHPNFFTDTPGFNPNIFNMASSNFANFPLTIDGGRQIKFWLKYSF